MIWHLLKLTWNRRKSNFLLVLEFFLAFLVLSIVTLLVRTILPDNQKAGGFRFDNVMYMAVSFAVSGNSNSPAEKSEHLKLALNGIPEVEDISTDGVLPFQGNGSKRHVTKGNITIDASAWHADDRYANVMSINMTAGRWFVKDEPDIKEPVILNSYLKEELFGDESAIGKTVRIGDNDRLVIGVTGPFRPDAKQPVLPGFFRYQKNGSSPEQFTAFVKFKNATNAKSYQDIIKIQQRLVNKDDKTIQITSLDDWSQRTEGESVTPFLILAIICVFLLLNAAIGLFSVLWQNIRSRRSELGIRRAVGGSSRQIYYQIIIEVVLLVTTGLIPGAILISQLATFVRIVNLTPIVYLRTFISSALIIYILVIICALYPASLASKVQPAEALHDE